MKNSDNILFTKCIVYLVNYFGASIDVHAKKAKEIFDNEENLLLMDMCYLLLKIFLLSAYQNELAYKEDIKIPTVEYCRNEYDDETHNDDTRELEDLNKNVDDDYSSLIQSLMDAAFFSIFGENSKEWQLKLATEQPLNIVVIIMEKINEIYRTSHQPSLNGSRNCNVIAARMGSSFICLHALMSYKNIGMNVNDSNGFTSSFITIDEFSLIQAFLKPIYLFKFVEDTNGIYSL